MTKLNKVKSRVPHCDITTGKIYGCKKHSFYWYHEKGHLKLNSSENFSTLKLIQEHCFVLWMIAITLSILNKYMLYIALPLILFFVGVEVYEEIWANNYARKQINKRKYL